MKNFSDDYEVVITMDEKGDEKKETVYKGRYFEIPLDEDGIVRFRKNCFLLVAVIAVLHIAAGFVANPGMYRLFISLPYALAFFPLLYIGIGATRLPKVKRSYRRDEIRLSFDRVKVTSIVLAATLGGGVIGEVVYLLFFTAGLSINPEFIYLAIELICLAFCIILIVLQGKIKIQASSPQKADS